MAGTLVWMDMEMTGLEPETCAILEIATVITNDNLEILAEGPNLVIRHDRSVLDAMDDWNKKHHGESGLIDKSLTSPWTVAKAEAETLAFVKQHAAARESPLCGNTIWQDRRFLMRYMPALDQHLHYRNIDVSTLKELVKRWMPEVVAPKKKGLHTARQDILESIDELRFYRSILFKV